MSEMSIQLSLTISFLELKSTDNFRYELNGVVLASNVSDGVGLIFFPNSLQIIGDLESFTCFLNENKEK